LKKSPLAAASATLPLLATVAYILGDGDTVAVIGES
jgi:hypothetical protein